MDHYVTAEQCEQTKATIRSRIKWLGWLLMIVLGVTSLTAHQAWSARSGFDRVNSRMARQTGISETQVLAIQRSLDRIDRKLEQQEAVLMQLLRNNTRHDP